MLRNQKRTIGVVPARNNLPGTTTHANVEDSLPALVLKNSLFGMLVSILTGLLLVTAMTAFAHANPNPTSLLSPLSLAALLPAMFAGGFLCVKRTGDAPLLCGIVCGGMMTLLTMLLSLILRGLPSSAYSFWQSALLHALAILFCVLGAFAGNVKRKPKPMSKRYR